MDTEKKPEKCIVLDLDGVIGELRKPGQGYADLQPLPGAVETIRKLRAARFKIIISTARHMKTCNGNIGILVK
jgi:histidinol phosphatase-like enzyme